MKQVGYVYNPLIETYNYGHNHPMKPKRVGMTHDLISGYGLLAHLSIYKSPLASRDQLIWCHDEDYIDYIKNYNFLKEDQRQEKYGIDMSSDTPSFPEFYDFC